MNTGTVLDKIAAKTLERLRFAKRAVPLAVLAEKVAKAAEGKDFEGFVRASGPAFGVIAEIKRASPSSGTLLEDFDPGRLAVQYENAGASALSVLTEPDFFGGSNDDLSSAREVVGLPLLRKDFIFDPYQIAEAKATGADAILLIVSLLKKAQLRGLQSLAWKTGLQVLVEVHDEDEMKLALDIEAKMIGVNNRNLKTLEVDLGVSERLAPLARGSSALLISESGIKKKEDLARLSSIGYGGFLIGTSLMKSGDPGRALRELLKEGR